jgi:putative endonuclease
MLRKAIHDTSSPESNPVWWVYIIRCRDGVLYTGITVDVARRVAAHANSTSRGSKFLRGKGPLELVFTHPVGSRSLASKVEYKIKRLKKISKEALVDNRTGFTEILASVQGWNPLSPREF